MIEDPDRWAPAYAEAGAQSVTFHVEAARDPRTLARTLRAAGARAGMAIKPGTQWAPYAELLPELDMVLVMTVEPGFGGQSFMADQMPKVAQVRDGGRAARRRGLGPGRRRGVGLDHRAVRRGGRRRLRRRVGGLRRRVRGRRRRRAARPRHPARPLSR